jgi:hypothetical protein
LAAFRSKNTLPQLNAQPNTSILASTEQAPRNARAIFNQVQKFAFGKTDLIALRTCKGCRAVADANSMAVYIDPEFLKTLDQIDLTKFETMSPAEQQAETERYFMMAALGHAEVDLLSLLTLKDMGTDISPQAIRYFRFEISQRSPKELAKTDFEIRLKTVIDAFPLF